MKIITASALGIAFLFALSFQFLKASEASVNSLSQIAQPTPPSKKPSKEVTSQAQGCSPQPAPLSEEEKNDPDRREDLFGESTDWDCDGICDIADNCSLAYNPDQKDSNKDGHGNACDPKLVDKPLLDLRCDMDGDGVPDDKDNCNLECNPDQKMVDINGNNIHDACDSNIPDMQRPRGKPCVKRIKVKPPKH